MFLFMKDKVFNCLFEIKKNNITDYNDENFTGGIEIVFRHIKY